MSLRPHLAATRPQRPPPSRMATTRAGGRRGAVVATMAVAAGAAALAVGGGVVLGLASASQSDVTNAQNAHTPGTCASGCSDVSSALDRERAEAITGYALLGGAAVVGVGAFLTWEFLAPHAGAASAAIQVVPVFGSGTSGLVLRGNF